MSALLHPQQPSGVAPPTAGGLLHRCARPNASGVAPPTAGGLLHRCARPNARRHGLHGQVMVLTWIALFVVVVAMLMLYRAGRMTTDKMAMQNAADALAYSVSTVEARDLNFASYLNRAIIANEVAIGQAIGMASWAYHWKSIGDFLLEYNKFLSGPTLGISNAVLPPMASVFQISGGVFVTLMRAYAKAMTAVNHNINKIYGIAQQIYHLTALINSLGLLEAAIEDNAPDDAHMSAYGVLMLLSHLATYGSLPTGGIVDMLPSMIGDNLQPFTQSYSPAGGSTPPTVAEWQADTVGDTDAGGYGRLSALIKNSGDPFTKGSHNPPYHDDPDLTGRGWIINFFELMREAGLMPSPITIGFDAAVVSGSASFGVFTDPMPPQASGPGWLGFSIGGGVDFGIVGASVEYELYLRIRMMREGGSELRMVVPVGGDKAAGELFSWSSADTTNFDLGFAGGGGFDAWIRIPFVGKIDLISADVQLVAANNNLFLAFSFGGADVVLYDGDFPTSAPMGAAFVHSGTSTGANANALTIAPEHMGTSPTGPIPDDAYGGSATHLIAWYYPPSLPVAGIYYQPQVFPERNVTQSYKGLPRYIDTTEEEALFGSGGPYLVVGLTHDQDDFTENMYASNPDTAPKGEFELKEAFAWDSMSALAKSEVHFKRPLDLDYFARGDGYVEHGSAFNPYWTARLVETSHAERVVALLLQHGENAQDIPDMDVSNLLSWLGSALGF